MEARIRERFNDRILAEVARRYGLAPEQLDSLGGFESFIYEFRRDGQAYILRIAHSLRRNEKLIRGEVAWINYLADRGAAASRAILSEAGHLVEPIADGHGGFFLATAFEKARGGPPIGDVWGPDLFERYGAAVGRIHALSRDYEPPAESWRPQWDAPLMTDIGRNLPDDPLQAGVLEQYDGLLEQMRALPQPEEAYGPIHLDPHLGNFFVDDEGTITFFDFDDCAYGHFIYDVAMALFYSAHQREDEAAFTDRFLRYFLKGYYREMDLDPFWIEQLPLFLKLREIDLYAAIHRSFDVDNLSEAPWVARFMEGRREKIERGDPFLDYDFVALAAECREKRDADLGSDSG